MSRAKRTRKAKMSRRQTERLERLEKRLDEVHDLLADLRERSRFRKTLGAALTQLGIPRGVNEALGLAIDPIGAGADMIKRHVEHQKEESR